MKHLYQPVYEYVKAGFTMHFTFHSSIVYDTEEQARLRAIDNWSKIKSKDETLFEITIQVLTINNL